MRFEISSGTRYLVSSKLGFAGGSFVFTASFEGDTYYWEHLGMLSVPSYREAWERKRKWYKDNGYADRLVTSEDGPDGSIDAAQIERIARERIFEQ